MPLVYIILLNYNGFKDTIECVNSLEKISYDNYKVVIIDNKSTNNSEEILRKELPTYKIIQSGENLGFAAGNNIGIKYALEQGAEYVLLLNNDTLVDKDFLNYMIKNFEGSNKVGAVGCKIMYYPDTKRIWYAGGEINWFTYFGKHFGFKEIDNGQYDAEREINFVTGCCILVSKKVMQETNFLPEDYFMYFEDDDFCAKISELGYTIVYNPKAVIYHKVGISKGGEETPFVVKWGNRNRLVFMKKYKHKVSIFKFHISLYYFYFTRVIKFLQYKFTKRDNNAKAMIEGLKLGREYMRDN